MLMMESAMAVRFPAVEVENKKFISKMQEFESERSRLRRLMGGSILRKSKLLRKSIRASTEYLGSAPDPSKQNRRQRYHPFEDIAESTSENSGDARLTAAETTRTIIEDWVAVHQDENNEDDSDSDETLGDWAKLETMRYSHPMSFAKTLAQVALDEPIDWMEQPPAGLAIQGIIRPALIEEHSDIQKHMSGSHFCNPDINQVGVDEKLDDVGAINGEKQESQPLKDGSFWSKESMKDEIPQNGISFYKLEMIKIQLISVHGHQVHMLFIVFEHYSV
ncbi:hypothetical protein HS088_TW18G01085 [Tripterygium wilfordii]|uniref:Uncharacterized protein n=1 Tax=Tripterygium wilfordii TaxID=458696 RepID=A0A7J7CDZ7_TRIWF|nr:hypothetical protein HS088_TW18G01085 [Tripterygium wilfordii]